MVKLAPPAFVVAMVAAVMWIPWALCQYLVDLPAMSAQYIAINTGITVGAMLVTVAAFGELAVRTRGGIRAWLVVSAIATLLAMLVSFGGGFFGGVVAGHLPYELWIAILQWSTSVPWLIAWLAFGFAGWSAQRRTAITLLAMSIVLSNLPPVREHVYAPLGPYFLFFLYVINAPIRNVIAILLAGAIAKRAHEPSRDHLKAARSAKVLAFAIGALALVQLASAVGVRLISEEIDVRFGFTVSHLVAALLVAFALWRLAQQQLPALPRYRVHVAALIALYTAGMLAETFTYTMSGGADTSFHAAHVAWWHLVPVTLALACLVTILLTYAKHRDAVYTPALLGGALFIAGVAGWFILKDHEVISPVSLACGYLALVPAVLRASHELSTDRVQTTADVFA